MRTMNRRKFVQSMLVAPSVLSAAQKSEVPSYLHSQAELYQRDPHAAAVAWFKSTKWGLFMHYGLYSQLGRGEWVMLQEKIPLQEYEKLLHKFAPVNFDAQAIVDLALA